MTSPVSCLALDRIGPTQRPAGPAAGTQRWRDLLFMHWSFPVEVLRPLVPAALDLDPWDGKAWVGLVPFTMQAVRSSWMPRRAGLDFLETNVRTYVAHRGQPGVYFFSLEASSWLAVKVARLAWGLPYYLADMEYERTATRGAYRSRRRADGTPGLIAEWDVGGELGPSRPGTLEFFLLERYLLFSEHRGRIKRGHVHHVPYPAQRATIRTLDQDLLQAAGLPETSRLPEVTHYSSGVDVEVFGPHDVAL